MDTVRVSESALRQVLNALNGPPHLIREIQAMQKLPFDNPLNTLVEEFNAAIEAHNTSDERDGDTHGV